VNAPWVLQITLFPAQEVNFNLRHRARVVVAVLFLAACSLMIDVHCVFGVSSQDASTAIANAEQTLQAAFVNVSNAESAGVNVTGLLSQLNYSGSVLTAAEAAMASGNYSEAVSEAMTSETLANNVAQSAITLKAEAGNWFSSFWVAIVIGIVSAGLLVVILTFMWLWFKRNYIRNLSRYRPDVTA